MSLYSSLFGRSKRSKFEEVKKITTLFMSASTVMIPAEISEKQKSILYGYLFGVTDYLSQCKGLGQPGAVQVARAYLHAELGSSLNTSDVLEFGIRTSEDPDGQKAWVVGGEVIRDWITASDKTAPLRLAKLMM